MFPNLAPPGLVCFLASFYFFFFFHLTVYCSSDVRTLKLRLNSSIFSLWKKRKVK